ncbi:hypothetical protein G9A89_015852 [Geosiphon pyriformis]|nr:hypothetical protein G9A89_015852 [Geosiphon pyriformis]
MIAEDWMELDLGSNNGCYPRKEPLTMFLVGIFQGSVPNLTTNATVVKGAVAYGLNIETVRTRTLPRLGIRERASRWPDL